MDAKTLLEVVETRMKCSDENNPTTKSFLFELHKALERLQELEKKEAEKIRINSKKHIDI